MVGVVTRLESQMFLLSDVTALALEFSPCLLLNGYGALLYRGKEAGTSNWPIISASMRSKSDLLPPGFLTDLFNCRDNCLLRCNIVKCHKITYVSEGSFCFHLQGRKLIYTSRHFWQTRDVISQKTIIFTFTAVRTSDLTYLDMPRDHRSVVRSIEPLLSS